MKKKNRMSFILCLSSAACMAALSVLCPYKVSAKNGSAAQWEFSRLESSDLEASAKEITIASVEDFALFASKCYIDSWSAGKVINLSCDLDFTGCEIPVVPVFNGTFNGNGHNVTGFNYEGSGYVTALFRYVEQYGVIKDLNVYGNVSSTDEKECIGGIVGINYGTIKNCSFQGTVDGMTTIGGIAAVNKGCGTISKCSVSGKISAYYFTGGIVGKNHGVVINCRNKAGVNDIKGNDI